MVIDGGFHQIGDRFVGSRLQSCIGFRVGSVGHILRFFGGCDRGLSIGLSRSDSVFCVSQVLLSRRYVCLGGVDRIGGSGADRLLATYRELGIDHPVTRDHLMRLHAEEHIRQSTNARVRATVKAGGTPGPAASIGKVHQGHLNQQLQLAACELAGMEAISWEGDWLNDMPYATKGMIRSRANTIEGGTTEVNKNVLGEQVLGLPREPDPYHGVAWKETPR